MAEFKDTDLFLINRDNQSYKVTGAEVKDSLQPAVAPIIGSVVLTEDDPDGAAFTDQSFTTTVTMTEPGKEPAQLGLQATVEGTLNIIPETSEIVGVSSDEIINYDSTISASSTDANSGTPANIFQPSAYCNGLVASYGSAPTGAGCNADARPTEFGEVGYSSAPNGTITFTPPDVFAGIEAQWYFFYANYGSPTQTYFNINNTGNNGIGCASGFGYYKFQGVLTSFSTTGGGNFSSTMYAIYRNGQQLVNGDTTTTLTLSTDKDLALFGKGDFVYQDNAIYSTITDYASQWTNVPVITPGRTVAQMFDGDTSTMYQSDTQAVTNSTPPTWTMVYPGEITKLEVYVPAGSCSVTVNSTVTTLTEAAQFQTVNLPSTTINNPTILLKAVPIGQYNAAYVSAWRINDKILVDRAGLAPSGTVSSVDRSAKTMTLLDVLEGDNGTVWSDYVTITGDIEGDKVVTNGFDGSADTQFSCTGNTATFIPPTPFTGVHTLSGKWCGESDTPSTITAYDGDTVVGTLSNHQGGYGAVPLSGSNTISKIVVQRARNTGWFYISVEDSILIDGTGPAWSANTGNYTIGPEKVFFEQAETSEIVGVVDDSTPISADGSFGMVNPQYVFDGSLNTFAMVYQNPGQSGTGTLIITPTIPAAAGTLEVYCSAGATSSQVSNLLDWFLLNGTVDISPLIVAAGAFTTPKWIDCTGLVDEVTSIVLEATYTRTNPSIGAIRQNGVILTSVDQTTLTLDTNKDLELFEQGDYVYQDNATGIPLYSSYLSVSGGEGTFSTPKTYAFDGNTSTVLEAEGSRSRNSNALVTLNTTLNNVDSLEVYIRGDAGTSAAPTLIRGQGIVDTVISAADSDSGFQPVALSNTSVTDMNWQVQADGSLATRMSAIKVNGSIIIDGPGFKPSATVSSVDTSAQTMTLTDVVEGSGNPDYGTSGTLSGTTTQPINGASIPDPVNVFDGNLSTNWEPFGGGNGTGQPGSGTPCVWTLDAPINYSSKVEFNLSTNADNMGYILNSEPEVQIQNSGNTQTWIEVTTGSGSIQSFALFNNNSSKDEGTIRLFAIRVDGEIVVSGTGFAWSANTGNYVIGPKVASGSVQLYCKLDESLNVIDLQSANPGYVDFDGLTPTLKFPAVFPNGDAPDEELPAGTSIQTKVQAKNTTGEDTKESNVVVPVSSINAEMHGLRFDPARKPVMQKQFAVASSNIWTYSGWLKQTNVWDNIGNPGAIFGARVSSTYDIIYYESSTNTVAVTGNTGNYPAVFSDLPLNVWKHVVVSYDGTDIKISLDGDTQTINAPGKVFYFNTGALHTIGSGVSTNSTDCFPGYLSADYFVDGQALSPTVFGQDVGGKWAPKSSVDIDAGITAAGGFGTNGFYLPFNPDAQGVNYIESFVATAGSKLFENAPNGLFNGDFLTGVKYDGAGATGSAVMTLSTPITTSGTITVYYLGTGTNRTIQFNSETPQTFVVGDSATVRTAVLNAPTTINSITFQNQTGPTASLIVSALEVDGVIIVDYNNIGVDASGNNNNFYDQNFAVGNTEFLYSGTLRSSNGLWDDNTVASDAFNGNTSDIGARAAQGESLIWDVSSFNFTGELGLLAGDNRVLTIDGVAQGTELSSTAVVNYSVNNPKVIEIGPDTVNTSGSDSGGRLQQVILNGVTLIDNNIQDSVTDTPTLSYAVLQSGQNGNLTASSPSNITYVGESGINYYYEQTKVDGRLVPLVHPGGEAFTSDSTSTYNFGQQSFGYVHKVNTSQAWEGMITGATSDTAERAFDGDMSTAAVTDQNGETLTVNFSPPISNVSLVRIFANNISSNTVGREFTCACTIDDTEQQAQTDCGAEWATIYSGSAGALSQITSINTGLSASARIAGIEVNGEVLVDPSTPIGQAYGNYLAQTWEEWNFDSLNYNNPVDRAIFNNIKALLESYEGNRDVYRATLKTQLQNLNIPANHITALGL